MAGSSKKEISMKYAIILCLMMVGFSSVAQTSERERVAQLEQQKEFEKGRKVRAQMDSGIYYLNLEEYELADEKFRSALSNMKSIPSDLTFYFGKNSFYLNKYKQSIDWLTKYIQLKGTAGQFYAEGIEIMKQAETALLEERQAASTKVSEVLTKDYNIDCGPSGRVTCPVCNGSTVIIKKDYLGETYKTCLFCNHLGYLTCEEYNKLIRGQLKPSTK